MFHDSIKRIYDIAVICNRVVIVEATYFGIVLIQNFKVVIDWQIPSWNTFPYLFAVYSINFNSIQGKEFDKNNLVELLTQEYEVDADTAAKDVEALVAQWMKAGIIE